MLFLFVKLCCAFCCYRMMPYYAISFLASGLGCVAFQTHFSVVQENFYFNQHRIICNQVKHCGCDRGKAGRSVVHVWLACHKHPRVMV